MMPVLLSFLIICFFALFGLLLVNLLSAKKVSVMDRLQQREVSSVLKDEEKETYIHKLERTLAASRTGITVPIYFAIILVSAIVIYLVVNFLTDAPIVGIVCAFAAFFIPGYVVDSVARRNKEAFDSMFVRALRVLSSSLKAQSSLPQAVQDVVDSDNLPMIIRNEFAQVLADYNYDGDMSKAFMKMYERTGDKDVKGVAMSIKIAAKYSSKLDEVFDSYADAIMNRKEMNAEGKAMLASTRMNTIIVCLVPFIFGVAMKIIQPDYFDYAYNWLGGLGRYIIVALYAIVVVGFLYLNKKCDINVE